MMQTPQQSHSFTPSWFQIRSLCRKSQGNCLSITLSQETYIYFILKIDFQSTCTCSQQQTPPFPERIQPLSFLPPLQLHCPSPLNKRQALSAALTTSPSFPKAQPTSSKEDTLLDCNILHSQFQAPMFLSGGCNLHWIPKPTRFIQFIFGLGEIFFELWASIIQSKVVGKTLQ